MRRGGGIGIRAGLRSLWERSLVGSNPTLGTNIKLWMLNLRSLQFLSFYGKILKCGLSPIFTFIQNIAAPRAKT